jgi:hypothetical protein
MKWRIVPPRLGPGADRLARYHLYFFDDNALLGDDRIEAADDASAIRAARAQGRGRVVEVWNARACIRVLAPARAREPSEG